MNPTNPMTMHDLVRAEHAYRASKLDQRRVAREAIAAYAAKAETRKTEHSPSLWARTHRRAALAAATVAMLLAMVAGAAVSAAPGTTKPAAAPHAPAGGHAPLAL